MSRSVLNKKLGKIEEEEVKDLRSFTSSSLLIQATEKEFTLLCQEAKYKLTQAVEQAWNVYHQAKAIGGLPDVEARLEFRESITPAEVEYYRDLLEAGAKRSQVIQEWVRPR